MPIPSIIDTHCHYNLEPLYSDWQTHWQQTQRAGVIGAVVVGTNEQSSTHACEIASTEPRLLAAVGIHPSEAGVTATTVTNSQDSTLEYLLTMITRLNKISTISAIGETGLDYFRLSGTPEEIFHIKQQQQTLFTAHLEAATKLQVPVLIHVRDQADDAYRDVIKILSPFASKLTIILHCFSGPEWYLTKALSLGCYISFAGNITYPSATNLRQHLNKVPIDRLLVETDAPFLPPQLHRGQPCEPHYIAETVRYLHDELGIDPTQLVNNARQIFTTIPLL